MINIPSDLSALSKQQLQELAGSCTQDVMKSDGADYMTAWGLAKTRCKPVFDELQKRADAERSAIQPAKPILSNEDRAKIAQASPSEDNCNTLGLSHRNIDFDSYQVAQKAAGNLASPNFEKAFSALSDYTANKPGISSDQADQQVAVAHPELKKKRDMQVAQRQLAQGMPAPDEGFQRDTREPAASAMFDKPLPAEAQKRLASTFSVPMANDSGATALGNSNEPFYAVSDAQGWRFF